MQLKNSYPFIIVGLVVALIGFASIEFKACSPISASPAPMSILDTVTVSEITGTGNAIVALFGTKKGAGYTYQTYQQGQVGNAYLVYDTVGVDSIHLQLVSTDDKIRSWDLSIFYFRVSGIPHQIAGSSQNTVNYANWKWFTQPSRLPLLNLTTAKRDSLYQWSLAPKGTMIFNTTIDSAQIKASGTIWRTN